MRSSFSYLMLPILVLAACQSAPHNGEPSQTVAAYEVQADSTKFANDITALNSPSRKRVRTADVRCRVNNVFHAASILEQVVTGLNGIIVESHLQNEFGVLKEVSYTTDSLKRIQLYTPTANLTLRVPAASLDSVVHALTGMAAFIDYRTLKEQDKTWDYLTNALKNKKMDASPVKPGKDSTPLDVMAYQDRKKEYAFDRKIMNLAILDDVNYATFTVQLFQPQVADVQVVVNPEQVTRAGFGTELLTALRNGADAFRSVVLFLLQLWPFLILLGVGWYGYRKMQGRYVVKSVK
ncbi:protein of unknown function [Chitinophaga rupis]|uniref:DUF4349 domain-containing protein n=1 Tax=Chitinophaga rupis TaxID=573321 RepID=A0A1H8HLJ5_9BACT|nr:DUF4349 domain-containing protein [Chitinophaga rupis]SEN57102.1 protein of unknown function [Chitinophaga rupis]